MKTKTEAEVTGSDIEKLPGRFRRYIQTLESKVRAHEALQAAQAPTRISIEGYGTDAANYVNERNFVRFRLDDGSRWDQFINCKLVDGPDGRKRLEVGGGDTLVIYPRVANVIEVGTRNQ